MGAQEQQGYTNVNIDDQLALLRQIKLSSGWVSFMLTSQLVCIQISQSK